MKAEDKSEAAELGVKAIKEVFRGSGVAIFLHKDKLVMESMVDPENAIDKVPEFEIGEGLAGKAFEEGESRLYENIQSEKEIYNKDTSIMSELMVPLGEHGLLMVGSTEKTIDDTDFYLAKIVGANIESIMDTIEREKSVETHVAEIQEQDQRLKEFSSVVSHDLRNPLNLAKGYLDLARETKSEEDFDEVDTALSRMEEIVDHLLFIARQPEKIDLKLMSMKDVFEDVWTNLETEDSSYEVEDFEIEMDPMGMKRFIENLVTNSLRHNNGSVRIEMGETEKGFYYADDGEGISDSEK